MSRLAISMKRTRPRSCTCCAIYTPRGTRFSSLRTRRPSEISRTGALNSNMRSEERRVGKECRSRCDWSSDVCSSDLLHLLRDLHSEGHTILVVTHSQAIGNLADRRIELEHEIGRASCRERV